VTLQAKAASEPTRRPASRLRALFRAFATRGASFAIGGGGGSPRPRRRLSLALLAFALLLSLALLATPALASVKLEVNSFEPELKPGGSGAPAVYATRAYLLGVIGFKTDGVPGSKEEASYRIDYSTSASGPWTLASSGTVYPKNAGRSDTFPSATIQHLKPETTYHARLLVDNGFENASATLEFTTTPVAAPEVLEPRFNLIEGGEGTAVGVDYADFGAKIQTNGAATHYLFEIATAASGPWAPASGTGVEGDVTVAADFAEAPTHITGLAPETTYYLRVVAENEKGKTIEGHRSVYSEEPIKFTTNPRHPYAGVGSGRHAETVTETSAHLHGYVVPHGSETHYRFESATSESGPWAPVPGSAGTVAAVEADEKHHEVFADIAGLSPATTYYFRVSAENAFGPSTTGGDSSVASFETLGPPTAATFAVHALTTGEGVLRALGQVDPRGRPTSYLVEYVTQKHFEEAGFSEAAFTPAAEAGKGRGGVLVGQDLPALQPGVQYRYRLSAESESETGEKRSVHGAEQTLTDPALVEPEPEGPCPNEAFRSGLSASLPDCRAYEQVTPVDKGGALEPFHYATTFATGVNPGQDGEHLAVVATATYWGAGPHAGQSPYFFSRTLAGWQMTAAAPQPEAGFNRYVPELFSPDLTRFAFEAFWNAGRSGGGQVQSPNVEFKAGPPGGPYATVASIPRAAVGEGAGGGWAAASADFSKLILAVEDHKLLGSSTGTTSGFDLYEYTAQAGLRQVNLDAAGKAISSCGAALASGREGGGTEDPTAHQAGSRNSVSADGRRVFFTDGCTHHLYVRTGGAETADIGEYGFIEADPQGSTVLISHNGELFRYHTETQASEPVPAAESLSPQGRYVEGLPPEITGFTSGGSQLTVNAALFGTKQDLFGQVVRYDSVEHVIQCVSCASPFDPEPKLGTGLRPNSGGALSQSWPTKDGMPSSTVSSANGDYVFFETPAALIPSDVNGEVPPEPNSEFKPGTNEFYPRPDGSPSNDVYEWRRDGLHGCAHLQGCLALITPGNSDGFLIQNFGTPDGGRDLFIYTNQSLLPSDNDTSGDVYDVRIGGGFAEPARPVECEGDACSTPFAAPNDLTPSSSTFHGAGNTPGATLPQVKPKPKPKARRRCTAKAKRKCRAKPKRKTGKRAGRAPNKRRAR
jgi:hypothetical protein